MRNYLLSFTSVNTSRRAHAHAVVPVLGVSPQAAMSFDPCQNWLCVILTARYVMIAQWTLPRLGIMLQ